MNRNHRLEPFHFKNSSAKLSLRCRLRLSAVLPSSPFAILGLRRATKTATAINAQIQKTVNAKPNEPACT